MKGVTMKKLTFREIKLLNILLTQEFVSAEELIQASNISLRTLHAEISFINDALAKQSPDIQIINQRGKGYALDYPMEQINWIEKLNRHCKNYLNVSLNKRFSENLRIAFICREFFATREYTKIEDIALAMNVSVATVNKDMRAVRHFLKFYGLSLQSMPYYGMIIEGQEQAIRSCMIDLLDIYSYSEAPLFFEMSLEQYGLRKEEVLKVMAQARSVLAATNYPLTDSGFRRVIKYLLIFPLREGLQSILSEKESQLIHQLPTYLLAKQLLPPTMPQEIEMFALFLFNNSEVSKWTDETVKLLLPEVSAIHQHILQRIYQQYGLQLTAYPDFSNYLLQFFYQFQLRKTYHFTELEVLRSTQHVVKKFSSSVALASTIYCELPQWQEADFYDRLFFDFVMHLYNLACRLKNEYEPTRIIVINEGGKIANETLMVKLKQYSQYNVHYHYHYFYELENLDFKNYDFVFLSDAYHYDTSKIPIPTLTFDFFLSHNFVSLLWSRVFVSKRKFGSVINYLVHPQISEIVLQISNYLWRLPNYHPDMPQETFQKFIEMVINTADYSHPSVNKLLNLFATEAMEDRYFIFRFAEPVFVRGKKISSLQFVFLDISKGLLEIKNGDSQFRRYVQQ
jgi:hypothetical protein